MTQTVAFAYPAARLHAQYGRLLSDAQWERLLRIPDYALFVQSARDTALRPWVQSLGPATEPHQIEAQLRDQFRQRVRAVATWCPAAWRPAVLWALHLPDLSAAAHVLAGRALPPWLAAQPQLARLRTPQRPEASAALAEAWDAGRDLPGAWLERWFALWPAVSRQERGAADRLVVVVKRLQGGELTPEALRLELRRIFRRHAQAPAGVFAALVLQWLELLKLRGALMRRRLALPAVEQAA